MAECIICGEYTKFEKGLCTKHYYEKQENKLTEKSPSNGKSDTHGMNDKEQNYRYNMIKGRIAETLIQELFLTLKYNVFRYGMENTIPGIMELLKGVKSDVAEEIKRMPDFVVQNPKSNEVYFIEVKFRAAEKFSFSDLPKDYAWENAYFIIVSKKHIKCITYSELKEGKIIAPESRNYLGSRKEFDLDKEVIIQFCNFAVQFFESV